MTSTPDPTLPDSPARRSRRALRWSIPMLLPAFCLFVFWDLYVPLTADRASQQVQHLMKSGMEANLAAEILNANGFQAGVYDHEFIWVERPGRESLLVKFAKNIENVPIPGLKWLPRRITVWDYRSRFTTIKIPTHSGNRIEIVPNQRFFEPL